MYVRMRCARGEGEIKASSSTYKGTPGLSRVVRRCQHAGLGHRAFTGRQAVGAVGTGDSVAFLVKMDEMKRLSRT